MKFANLVSSASTYFSDSIEAYQSKGQMTGGVGFKEIIDLKYIIVECNCFVQIRITFMREQKVSVGISGWILK